MKWYNVWSWLYSGSVRGWVGVWMQFIWGLLEAGAPEALHPCLLLPGLLCRMQVV